MNTSSQHWKDWLKKGWVVTPLVLLGLGQCSLQYQLTQMGQKPSLKTLRVERLEVVNEAGQNVVVLGSLDGLGLVAVGDSQGSPRLTLEGDPKAGLLRLLNAHQDVLVLLGADVEGDGGVEVSTAKGIAHLGASTTGTPTLSLNTSGSTLFLGSQNDNDSEPVIYLRQGKETRVRIEAIEQSGVVRVWGPGGRFGNVFMPRY